MGCGSKCGTRTSDVWRTASDLIVTFVTCLLTPWSRVLLEKLTGSQLVKKFPAFYINLRFNTPFTSAHHLSLSEPARSTTYPPHPTPWRFILILSYLCLGLQSGSFPQVSPPKPCTHLSSPPYMLHAPPVSFFWILSPEQYWVRAQIIKLLIM